MHNIDNDHRRKVGGSSKSFTGDGGRDAARQAFDWIEKNPLKIKKGKYTLVISSSAKNGIEENNYVANLIFRDTGQPEKP